MLANTIYRSGELSTRHLEGRVGGGSSGFTIIFSGFAPQNCCGNPVAGRNGLLAF
ncbi:hypothetical protein KCP78_03280 [Salmonella enterica subsp. enterica]|nr:hypothetical protein KCP78_03280 [Salmonella enterica subsp. enterica]